MTKNSIISGLRVLLVEDYELVRQGLSYMLRDEGVNVIAEAENGEEALRYAKERKPDVILMDIGMPVMDGIAATQKIKELSAEIKIIMLTSHDDPEEVFAALSSGADAYCMKDIKVDRLCQVILMVNEGALWLDPKIAHLVLQALPQDPLQAIQSSQESGNGDMEKEDASLSRVRYNVNLTARETEVLHCIVAGQSNKQIAADLGMSTHTAKAHVTNIIHKLAVDDRTQAAVKALREGIVNLPEPEQSV